MSSGGSVLIHCLAGAHRAGTTGVAWLMYANGLSADDAILLAKSKRKQINPIGAFPILLFKLEKALGEKGLLNEIRKKVNAPEDHKEIIDAIKGIKKGNLHAAAV